MQHEYSQYRHYVSKRLKVNGITAGLLTELIGICHQYDDYKSKLANMADLTAVNLTGMPHGTGVSDPTYNMAARRVQMETVINDIEECLNSSVKNDKSGIIYRTLKTYITKGYRPQREHLPCSKNEFYRIVDDFYIRLAKILNKI